MLGKTSADNILIFFLIFPRKKEFDISYKLSLSLNPIVWEKIRKNRINLSTAESAHSVVFEHQEFSHRGELDEKREEKKKTKKNNKKTKKQTKKKKKKKKTHKKKKKKKHAQTKRIKYYYE